MTTPFLSFEQMAAVYKTEQDWLFEKLLTWQALIRTRHSCTTAIVEKALNDLIHHFDHRFYKKVIRSIIPSPIGLSTSWGQPAMLPGQN